jgi:hypothetical protein
VRTRVIADERSSAARPEQQAAAHRHREGRRGQVDRGRCARDHGRRTGRETIVAEVAARSDVASLLGGGAAAPRRDVERAPALHHVSIEPQGALAEYIRDEVPGRVPGMILARSRAFDVLATRRRGCASC